MGPLTQLFLKIRRKPFLLIFKIVPAVYLSLAAMVS